MKKITVFCITIILIVVLQMITIKTMAANIDEATARQYSVYYLSVMSGNKEADSSQVTLAYKFMNPDLNIPAAYVFNIVGQGFVIISGSDLWYPILGYSTEDLFNVNRMPPAFKWYFDELCDYIIYAQNTNNVLISDIGKEWDDLKSKTLPQVKSSQSVEWLLDCEWGQGDIYNPTYNKFCPYRDIDNERLTAVTGCVATAMSQIMYYWKYPMEPFEDTLRYLGCMIDDTVLFGDIAIDMSGVTYNFDTMPNKLTSTSTTTEIDEIATLCYHAGVSVEMGYGVNGSGAFSSNVPVGLRDVFLYDTMVKYENRRNYYVDGTIDTVYTNDEWISMLSEEIAASRPVYYAGCGMDESGNFSGGHAFVCDGQNVTDSNKFHFNWGWEGYLNMWCDVRNSDIGGTDVNFDYLQEIVRYIQPRPEPTCDDPIIENIIVDHESASITWMGGAIYYQLIYKESTASAWSDTIVTNQNNYMFTDLLPETNYMVKVRALCNNEVGHSSWTDTSFSTTTYVCPIPTDVVVSEITYESCTIGWNSESSRWIITIFNDMINYIDTIEFNLVGYSGFSAGVEYFVAVRSMCSDNELSEWSDTIAFTTNSCLGVSNLVASEITTNTAVITWDSPDAVKWEINIGVGINPGEGDIFELNGNNCEISGLQPNTTYDAYVRLYCTEYSYGEWSEKLTFTTKPEDEPEGIDGVDNKICFEIYPNPTTGSSTVILNGIEGKVEISVIDINGRTIINEEMECGQDCEKTLDVVNLVPGTYFVKVVGYTINNVRKLIVR